MPQPLKQICVLLKQSRHISVCHIVTAAMTTTANRYIADRAINLTHVENKCRSTCLAT